MNGTQDKTVAEAPGRLSSVASALMVLKAFSADEAEIGISALGKRLGLAKSTVHRLAVTLASEGFLEQNPETGRYRLGLALFSLGALVRKRMDVSNEARPLLGALRDKTQEAVRLAILSGDQVVFLYNLESSQALGIMTYIGSQKPAYCTAEGRAMLAFAPAAQRAAVIGRPQVARTPKTLVEREDLQRALDDVRAAGYAVDDEECEVGVRGLGAPVRDLSGRVVAAVGLAGPVQRLTKKDLRALAPEVVGTADAVSVRLGYRVR
jgi:DNA-binding IclR family transcriptional regulator